MNKYNINLIYSEVNETFKFLWPSILDLLRNGTVLTDFTSNQPFDTFTLTQSIVLINYKLDSYFEYSNVLFLI